MGFWVAITRKGLRHRVGLASYGDLTLLHNLQQGALHLGGGAVDLIGEQQVGKDRAQRRVELACLLIVDAGAYEVGGHEVGCELDALKLSTYGLGQRLHRHGLCQPRYALHEDVPPRQQGHHHALKQVVLAHNHLLHLVQHPLPSVDCCRYWSYRITPLGRLPRRPAGPTNGHVDGYRESYTNEEVVPGRIDQPGDDSDNLAASVHQRTARIARVHRRVELDQPPKRFFPARWPELAVEPGHYARTQRAEPGPRGLPTGNTSSPTRIADALPMVAGTTRSGSTFRRQDGDVAVRLHAGNRGGCPGAVHEGKLDLRRALYDVQRGKHLGIAVDDYSGSDAEAALFADVVGLYDDQGRQYDLIDLRRDGW